MSATARRVPDVGPASGMNFSLKMGSWSLDLLVRYTVAYPSLWHRGRGIDPDITILSVTYDSGVERKPFALLPGMHDEICLHIESDELGD